MSIEMRTILTGPRIVSSNDFFVRVRASDTELPVSIDIECAAIDGMIGSFLSRETRWRIVESNLLALLTIAELRYIAGAANEAETLGGRFRHITLRVEDLRKASLRLQDACA
jgi:hypothetical protein